MGRHCARASCPFCGHPYTDMLHYWTKYHPGHHEWRVKCCGCKAAGPMGYTKDDAVRLWTRRDFAAAVNAMQQSADAAKNTA